MKHDWVCKDPIEDDMAARRLECHRCGKVAIFPPYPDVWSPSYGDRVREIEVEAGRCKP